MQNKPNYNNIYKRQVNVLQNNNIDRQAPLAVQGLRRVAKQQDEMLWREADVSLSEEFGIARAMFWLVDTIIGNFSGILE